MIDKKWKFRVAFAMSVLFIYSTTFYAFAGNNIYVATTGGSDASADPTNPATPLKTIQAAFNHASLIAGSTVFIDGGTYSENLALSANISGLVIQAWTIGTDVVTISLTAGNRFDVNETDNIVIDSIIMSGGTQSIRIGSTTASNNVTIKNCTFKNNSAAAIWLTGSSTGFVLTNSTITSTGAHGVRLNGGDNATVSNNTIGPTCGDSPSENGIHIDKTNNAVIINNTIFSNSAASGIGITTNNNTVSGNVIYSLPYGVRISGYGNVSAIGINNVIQNNTIWGIATSAIFLPWAYNNTIANNVINSSSGTVSGGQGILLWGAQGNTVQNNTVLSTLGHGISVDYDTIYALESDYNVVQNNTVGSCGNATSSGIHIEFNSSGNTILNNVIYSSGQYGINLRGPSNVVSGNTIYTNTSDGINFTSNIADFNTISNNTIQSNGGEGIDIISGAINLHIASNYIFSNGGSGIDDGNTGNSSSTIQSNTLTQNASDGLRIYGQTKVINANIITSNKAHGINLVAATSDSNTISNNTIQSNTTDGINIVTGATNNTITSNYIWSNADDGIDDDNTGTASNVIQFNVIDKTGDNALEISGANIIIASNTIMTAVSHGINLISGSADNITISNNTIQLNGTDGINIASGATDNTITSNYIWSNADDGIDDDNAGTSNNAIQNNTITANASDGIEMAGASCTIASNAITSNKAWGISFDNAAADSNTIISNSILSNASGGITILSTAINNTIAANTIFSNGGPGIAVNGAGTQSTTIMSNIIYQSYSYNLDIFGDNNYIIGNTIYSPRGGFNNIILRAASTGHDIQNNTIMSAGGFGIATNAIGADNTTIKGNYIWGTGGAGLKIRGDGFKITNNTIGSCNSDGISLDTNCHQALVQNNVITSNAGDGIEVAATSTSAHTIDSNTIYTNAGHGINFSGSGADSNTISNNTIQYNKTDGINIASGATSNIIVSNVIYTNTDDGIEDIGGSNTYTNNIIYANGDDGIVFNGGDSSTVKNNTFYNNTGDGIELSGTATGSTITNNIIHSHGTNKTVNVASGTDGVASIDYNNYGTSPSFTWQGAAKASLSAWSTSTIDPNSIALNPRFVSLTAGSEDFLLQSTAGHDSAYTINSDSYTSPSIDRGTGTGGDETAPNGSLTNQGAYGGTAKGSRTGLRLDSISYDDSTSAGSLQLTFNINADVDNVTLGGITMQTTSSGGSSLALGTGTVNSVSDTSIVSLTLSSSDRDTIAGWQSSSLFLAVPSTSTIPFKDASASGYNAGLIDVADAMTISYTADTTAPTFSAATSSYVESTKILTLKFSETIDISATTYASITLSDNGSNSLTLSGYTSSSSDGTTMSITLSSADGTTIRGWASTNLYVAFSANAVKDMAGNGIAAASPTALGTYTHAGFTSSYTVTPSSTSLKAGASLTLTVTAKDVSGATNTTYSGTANLSITYVSPTTATTLTETISSTQLTSWSNGVATKTISFPDCGQIKIKATDASDQTITGTSSTITYHPYDYTVVPDTATQTVNKNFKLTITSRNSSAVTTPNYNGTANVSVGSYVSPQSAPSGVSLTPTSTSSVGFSSGICTLDGSNAAKYNKYGTIKITATDSSYSSSTGTSASIIFNPASFSVSVSAPPSDRSSYYTDENISPTVTALDNDGNVITNYTGTLSTSSSASNVTTPSNYAFLSGDSGAHIFTDGVYSTTAQTFTLSVSDTTYTSITGISSSISVITASIQAVDKSGPVGSLTMTINILDADGEIVTDDNSTTLLVTLTEANDNDSATCTSTTSEVTVSEGTTTITITDEDAEKVTVTPVSTPTLTATAGTATFGGVSSEGVQQLFWYETEEGGYGTPGEEGSSGGETTEELTGGLEEELVY